MVVAIPRQQDADYSDPEQRFTWALRGMEFNGFPMALPEQVAKQWSKHLSACGFVHIDQVRAAGSVDDLPGQTIHFQPPVQGQDHELNVSGGWVPVEEPIVEPAEKVTSLLTPYEKARMIQEFKEEGLID